MDFYLILKFGALLLGAISTLKLSYDWLYGRQSRLRDEYKFANDFLRDIAQNKNMHPYVRQKGYQAIAGDTRLSAGEIKYLLTLHDSASAIRDYVLGRPYLKYYATAQEAQISFHPNYKRRWTRLWRKSWYLVLYFLFFFGAFAPLFLPVFQSLPAGQELVLFAFSFTLLIPPGFLVFLAGVRIARAEVLVENQQKHSEGVLVG